MPGSEATAVAHPNIAFIKYWGNRNHEYRLPANSSLSMNMEGLQTRSTVRFDRALNGDELILNGERRGGESLGRVSAFLDIVRDMAGLVEKAHVDSENDFPSGAGIASSSSAFAALALAASRAAGLELAEAQLSRLARRGSGSASRSVPAGFVEWQAGEGDEDSLASSLAGPGHWGLEDCIAVVQEGHKETGSTQGHRLAESSPLQAGRLAGAEERLELCRKALLAHNFANFAEVVEQDSLLMHAVMMTSRPPLLYWEPATLAVMQAVRDWRGTGLQVCATVDAGPNVHVICLQKNANEVAEKLGQIKGVDKVLRARPGGGARLVE